VETDVGDEAVDAAKLLLDVVDELLDGVVLCDVNLVGLDLDAVLLGKLRRALVHARRAAVLEREVAASLCDALCGSPSETTRATRDNGHLALHAEAGEDRVRQRGHGAREGPVRGVRPAGMCIIAKSACVAL